MNSVTVPFSVSGLFSSYSAFPWCADTGMETNIRAIATTKNERRLLIASTPCRQDLGEDGTIHPAMPSNNARAKTHGFAAEGCAGFGVYTIGRSRNHSRLTSIGCA